MGVLEIALLQIASQILQGGAVFCGTAQGLIGSPTAKAAYAAGRQVLTNLNAMAVAGLVAANSEFATTQMAEKAWSVSANSLPPIT